jgi:hypothetical protein
MISFKTYDFATYALLNDRHAHMPFQSWRMRPKSTNHLLFTLNTQSFEITFEIRVSSAAFYLCTQDKKISLSLLKKTKAKTKLLKKKHTRIHRRVR